MNTLIPLQIDPRILTIRGQRILLDTDLAEIYGVTTKRLNEQIKRNRERFPEDFMFQLSLPEKQEVVANCGHLQRLKFSKALPFAFTEHGAIMAASVLNSQQAVEASVYVVRAFVHQRALLASHHELAAKSLSNITPCPLFTKDVYFGIQITHEYHLHHRRV